MNDTSNVTNTHNGHEFVDLGLPSGTLWATCNVGATSPEQAGLYFAFGETEGFKAEQVKNRERSFDEKSYKPEDKSFDHSLEQDAARAILGGNWQMPKQEDFEELIANCTKKRVGDYKGTGVSGRLFTSRVNGNSVFFPAAGLCIDTSVCNVGIYGSYWTSSSWFTTNLAYDLYYYSGYCGVNRNKQYFGRSLRGVCKGY